MSRALTLKVRDAAVQVAAKSFDIGPADILGEDRSRQVAYGRHYAMWLLREMGYSFPQIGRQLNKDHTTVIAGVRGHAKRAEADHVSPQVIAKTVDNSDMATLCAFNQQLS